MLLSTDSNVNNRSATNLARAATNALFFFCRSVPELTIFFLNVVHVLRRTIIPTYSRCLGAPQRETQEITGVTQVQVHTGEAQVPTAVLCAVWGVGFEPRSHGSHM